MKEKTKEFFKKYLIGFILGVVSAGAVIVYAETYFPSNDVTYDNKESGLTSTNVQGAIDELYQVCTKEPTAGDTILDNTDIVTSGDGLYEDEYEEGRYFYKGKNPSNYITFNNEQSGWRIISIEPDGTIKIMKNESIGDMAWDSANSNNWGRPASLNIYLNSTYYNGLNSTAQSQIVAKDWSIGSVTFGDSNMANTINNENSKKWNGKVALVTASEYVRSNSNRSSCGTVKQLLNAYSGQCKGTTWMYYSSGWWWTLSPYSNNSSDVFLVNSSSGNFDSDFDYVSNSYTVRPALYLSSEVTLTGSGTQVDPYVVS